MGGVLHLFKIPLTGLVIGSAAVLFIVLISRFQEHRNEIIKATFVVMIVKAFMSPNTPVNAYFALFTQGLIGQFILNGKRYLTLRAGLFGLIVMLLSASQKIIVLTIIYGNNLWDSINIFSGVVIKQFGVDIDKYSDVDASFWLILIYITIHALGGMIIGLWSSGLLTRLEPYVNHEFGEKDFLESMEKKEKKGKRNWWRKPGSVVIVVLSLTLYLISFYDPNLSNEIAYKPLILILRSVIILAVWFYWIGPLAVKWIRNKLQNKRSELTDEVDLTLSLIPGIKNLISISWQQSNGAGIIFRLWDFAHRLPANLLLNGKTIDPDGGSK